MIVDERLRAIAERLRREYGAERVLLYGSYARGEAATDSNVDLLVIAPSGERFFERMRIGGMRRGETGTALRAC